MLDRFITPIIKPVLTPFVASLHKRNISADQITFYGFVIGMLAVPLLAFNLWYWALAAIVVNRIFDGFDLLLRSNTWRSQSFEHRLDRAYENAFGYFNFIIFQYGVVST